MSRVDRRTVIGGLALGLMAGCGREEGFPIVDGRPPAEGGIGGTGIVGVVTGLGSVRVGGYRVATPAGTPVTDALGSLNPRALAPGQSLTVEADGPAEALVARRIHVTHPLIGTVEGMGRDARSLRVLGTDVLVEPGVTTLAQEGLRVAVSGLWRGKQVIASRVATPLEPGPDVLAGEVRAEAGGLAIGGLRIALPAGSPAPVPGTYVTVWGERSGDAFVAERIVAGRFTGAAGPLGRLVVEGYLEPVPQPPRYRLSGLGHSFDAEARLAPLAETRAVFAGPYTGDFAVAFAVPVPEGLDRRAELLNVPGRLSENPGAVVTR